MVTLQWARGKAEACRQIVPPPVGERGRETAGTPSAVSRERNIIREETQTSRLNQSSDSPAAATEKTAEIAVKSAVISVSFFSSVKRVFSAL
jgi:hypothetical protein